MQDFAFTSINNETYTNKWNILQKSRNEMSFTPNEEVVKYNDKKKIKYSTTEKTYRALH